MRRSRKFLTYQNLETTRISVLKTTKTKTSLEMMKLKLSHQISRKFQSHNLKLKLKIKLPMLKRSLRKRLNN